MPQAHSNACPTAIATQTGAEGHHPCVGDGGTIGIGGLETGHMHHNLGGMIVACNSPDMVLNNCMFGSDDWRFRKIEARPGARGRKGSLT